MCGIPKENSIKSCRLQNKMALKAYLIPRFKGIISSRVLKYFDFRTPIEYDSFIDQVERLLNEFPEKLKKMAFEAYDYDDDGYIKDLDLYCSIKLFKEDE